MVKIQDDGWVVGWEVVVRVDMRRRTNGSGCPIKGNMYPYLLLCTRHRAEDGFSIQHGPHRRLLALAIQQQLIMPRWTGFLFSTALSEGSSLLPFGSSWMLPSPELWWSKRAGRRCRVKRARRWQSQPGGVPPFSVRILQNEQLRPCSVRSEPVPELACWISGSFSQACLSTSRLRTLTRTDTYVAKTHSWPIWGGRWARRHRPCQRGRFLSNSLTTATVATAVVLWRCYCLRNAHHSAHYL